ncbi:MAG: phosphotransferase, partial [Geminicoccaceae bacterium]
MTDRDATIQDFLQVNGQGRALRGPLAGDASARRYERLRGGMARAVLMDAPPDLVATEPFVRIAAWLRRQGFSAPLIFAADAKTGLVLMEDLGDDLFSAVLAPAIVDKDGARQARETDLYQAAVDLLVELQRKQPPPGLPQYNDEKMLEEASLLTAWYASTLSDNAKRDYLQIGSSLLPAGRIGADAFVYVDYHADNLLWLP